MTGRTPAVLKPVAAATTCSATTPGRDEADRDPIVGSPGPDVTSASGAKSTVKPSPRSSAAPAAYASCVSPASPAAPALMKVGNRVAAPRSRSTTPPSWSTPRKSGHLRGTWRVSARLTALTCSAEATLALKAITPPRCRSRTIRTGASVPCQSATMTCPARSGSFIRPTIRAGPVQLGPGGTPPLGQPELLRRRRRDGRRARGAPCSPRSAPRPRPGPARRTRPATRPARGRLRGSPGARRGGSASRHGGTAPRIAHRPRRSGRSHGQSVSSQVATASANGWSSPARSVRTHDCTLTSCSSDALG